MDEGQVNEAMVRELLLQVGVDPEVYRPRDVLEVLERWLTYFFQSRYETARETIKLIRARRV